MLLGSLDTSRIWNNYYQEVAKLQYSVKWRQYGITHMPHILRNGKLRAFSDLKSAFSLPLSMYFYYLQLQHAFRAQWGVNQWLPEPTPIFRMLEALRGNNRRKPYNLLSGAHLMWLNAFPNYI